MSELGKERKTVEQIISGRRSDFWTGQRHFGIRSREKQKTRLSSSRVVCLVRMCTWCMVGRTLGSEKRIVGREDWR